MGASVKGRGYFLSCAGRMVVVGLPGPNAPLQRVGLTRVPADGVVDLEADSDKDPATAALK